MKSLTVTIDDDLNAYLEFLERMRFIKSKEEAVQKSLVFFSKLSMHSWLPYIYRIGGDRIVLMDRGMLLDVFESMTENQIYEVGKLSALKRKVTKPEFRTIDLTKPNNWMIVMNELENFGWGNFSKTGNEIKVENCAVPIQYLRGYLESMFKVRLVVHRTEIEGLMIFIAHKRREEEWR